MITIRHMHDEDLDAVRKIDALAFWTWGKGVKGELAQMVRRTCF